MTKPLSPAEMIHEADARRSQLQGDIERLADEVRNLDYAIGLMRTLAGMGAETGDTEAPVQLPPTGVSVPTLEPFTLNGRTIADAAADLLRTGPQPMKVLLQRLQAEGRLRANANAYSTLYRTLSKSPRTFKKVGRGVWALVGASPARAATTPEAAASPPPGRPTVTVLVSDPLPGLAPDKPHPAPGSGADVRED